MTERGSIEDGALSVRLLAFVSSSTAPLSALHPKLCPHRTTHGCPEALCHATNPVPKGCPSLDAFLPSHALADGFPLNGSCHRTFGDARSLQVIIQFFAFITSLSTLSFQIEAGLRFSSKYVKPEAVCETGRHVCSGTGGGGGGGILLFVTFLQSPSSILGFHVDTPAPRASWLQTQWWRMSVFLCSCD